MNERVASVTPTRVLNADNSTVGRITIAYLIWSCIFMRRVIGNILISKLCNIEVPMTLKLDNWFMTYSWRPIEVLYSVFVGLRPHPLYNHTSGPCSIRMPYSVFIVIDQSIRRLGRNGLVVLHLAKIGIKRNEEKWGRGYLDSSAECLPFSSSLR